MVHSHTASDFAEQINLLTIFPFSVSKRYCLVPNLAAESHLQPLCTDKSVHVLGSTCHVYCQDGYKMLGSGALVCQEYGVWEWNVEDNLPQCVSKCLSHCGDIVIDCLAQGV